MKKNKVLDLELLNDTAKACLWYYGETMSSDNTERDKILKRLVARIFGSKAAGIASEAGSFYDKKKMKNLLIYAFLNGYTEKYVRDFNTVHRSVLVDADMLGHDRFSGGQGFDDFSSSALFSIRIFNYGILNYSDEDKDIEYGWCYHDDTKYAIVFKVLWLGVTQFDILKMFKYVTKKYLAAKAEALDKMGKSQREYYIPLKSGGCFAIRNTIRNTKYLNEK